MIGLVLVPPLFETAEDKWYYSVLPTCIVVGFCLAVIYLIPSAMLPDVVEVDELQTGQQQQQQQQQQLCRRAPAVSDRIAYMIA